MNDKIIVLAVATSVSAKYCHAFLLSLYFQVSIISIKNFNYYLIYDK